MRGRENEKLKIENGKLKNTDTRVIVFDLGGTLMEFAGMPSCWCDCYDTGFEKVNQKLGLELRKEQMEAAALGNPILTVCIS